MNSHIQVYMAETYRQHPEALVTHVRAIEAQNAAVQAYLASVNGKPPWTYDFESNTVLRARDGARISLDHAPYFQKADAPVGVEDMGAFDRWVDEQTGFTQRDLDKKSQRRF